MGIWTGVLYASTLYLAGTSLCYLLIKEKIKREKTISKEDLKEEVTLMFIPILNYISIAFLLSEQISHKITKKREENKKKGKPNFTEALFSVKEKDEITYETIKKERTY